MRQKDIWLTAGFTHDWSYGSSFPTHEEKHHALVNHHYDILKQNYEILSHNYGTILTNFDSQYDIKR